MKKLFILFLVILTVAATACVFAACDGNKPKGSGDGLPSGTPSSGATNSGAEEEAIFRTNGKGTILGLTQYGKTLTELVVPAKIGDETITKVETQALRGSDKVKSITVSEGIEKIGDLCFICESLESIYIASSVKNMGYGLFEYLTNLKSVTFGENSKLKNIGSNTFQGCSGLEQIVLPDSIETLGILSFAECSSLKSIKLPSSLKSIGQDAFYKCESITEIELPTGLVSIDSDAFNKCKSLTCVDVPAGVKSIGGSAFRECETLEYIKIPSGVEQIGMSIVTPQYKTLVYCQDASQPSEWNDQWVYKKSSPVIWDCDNNDVADDGYIYYKGNDNLYYMLKDGVAELSTYSKGVSGDIQLTSPIKYKGVDYPLKKIKSFAFARYADLKSVEIAADVIEIDKYAFNYCESLEKVIIPATVNTVKDEIINECPNVKIFAELNAPTSRWSSFWNRKDYPTQWGYKNIQTNQDYDYTVHADKVYLTQYKGDATDIIIPQQIDGKEVVWFGNVFEGKDIESIVILGGVKVVAPKAFSDCGNLQSVEMPDGLTSIGASAFYGCSKLTSVNIPQGITAIESFTFADCNRLSEIVLPEGTKFIGVNAFNRTRLTSIIIPIGVEVIEEYAFSSISAKITIYCEAESQPSGWENYWKSDSYEVVWGYKVEE